MTTFAELSQTAHAVDFKQGDLCHLELPVKDLERAKKLYGEVFGWQFQTMAEMGYTLFITPSGKLGGGFVHPENNEMGLAQPLMYLNVTSIEAAKPELEARGAVATSPKIDIPGHGAMMTFTDSEGNRIAIWQGA